MKYDLNDYTLVSDVLLGLHAFTGCDTESAFLERQSEALKLMIKTKPISGPLQQLEKKLKFQPPFLMQ